MQALILAGGKGTRLKPYTLLFPKPLLPIGGQPIIQTIVQQLAFYGFKDIVISLGYLGEYIKMFFNDKTNVPEGVTISYFEEDTPLGTAGPVALMPHHDENFLVINGDVLTNLNYADLYQYHLKKESLLTMAVKSTEIKMHLGIIDFNDDGQVTDFREKPTYTFNDNMGIYIYNKRALDFIPPNVRFDLNFLILDMIEKNETVYAYASKGKYYWIDVGQHADYENANKEFKAHKDLFLK
jgi:NDP-sugar pyrophosphorylase family protein